MKSSTLVSRIRGKDPRNYVAAAQAADFDADGNDFDDLPTTNQDPCRGILNFCILSICEALLANFRWCLPRCSLDSNGDKVEAKVPHPRITESVDLIYKKICQKETQHDFSFILLTSCSQNSSQRLLERNLTRL